MDTKRLEGVTIGRGAPEISRLLFADDSIFFVKATFQNVFVLKELLEIYRVLSGQRINYQKSEVVYNRNVSMEASDFFSETLAVRRVNYHAKYLGLAIYYGEESQNCSSF